MTRRLSEVLQTKCVAFQLLVMPTDLYQGHDPRHLPTYLVGEVAQLADVPQATVRSWVQGRAYQTHGGPRFFAPLIDKPEVASPLLSFVNLIEVHVLAALRRRHRVALPNIRRALDFLKEHSDSRHPLAEQTFETDGIDLFVRSLNGDKDVPGDITRNPINLSQVGQMAMREMIEAHLQRVERDRAGSPVRLFPFVRRTEEDASVLANQPRLIVIDPVVSFGKPVLAGTGLPVEVIISRYRAGDKISELAGDLGLKSDQIEDALHFYLNRFPLAA